MKKILKLVFIFIACEIILSGLGMAAGQTPPAKITKASYRIKEYKMDSLKFRKTRNVDSINLRKRVIQSKDNPAILLTETLDVGENTLLAASWKAGGKLNKATIRSAKKPQTQLGELAYDPTEGPDTNSEEYKRSAKQNRSYSEYFWTGKTGKVLLEIEIPARSHLEDFSLYAIQSPDEKDSLLSSVTNKIKSWIGSAWASSQPGIITRSQWGADESIRKDDPDYASELKKAIIHHTAGPNDYSKDYSDNLVRGIYAYHTQVKGWDDIGYNFLVDKYGQIFEGRYGGIDKNVVGAHAKNFNDGSTGISVMGTYQDTSPSTYAQNSIVNLLGWKLSEGVVDPDGWGEFNGKNLPNIIGHRDVGSTACPGNKLYDTLPDIRRRVDPLIHALNKSVYPSSAVMGYDQTQFITSTYAHANGANNISIAEILINDEASSPHNNAILVHYENGKLYLYSDDGSRLTGGIAPGTKGAKIENSQAVLDVERTTVSTVGNELRIKWAIAPKFSFLGKKNVYLLVKDKAGHNDGWDNLGIAIVCLNQFKFEFFNNTSLSGTPALTGTHSAINFDWGTGSPTYGINSDYFSARWTGSIELPAGAYEFSTTTDDGIRLWIDGKLLIDKWKDQGPTIYTAKTTLPGSGKHTIKMEYYERGGGAVAKLSWRNLFIGEYFNNAYLSGTPNLTRTDEKINFNWGSGSPASGIASDNFSVRWSSNKWFNEGAYRFTVKTDDGVRLWVDGKLLIDKWRDQGSTTYTADRIFSTGFHSIKMEYYEKGGGAVAKLSWSDIFKGEYFNNTSLSGSPALVRADDNINFDWGTGSPGSVVNNDNFSARWTSNKWFKAGAYKFSVTADDGIRLWVDGKLLIDQWKDQGPTAYTAKLVFSNDGKHSIKMEYYERGGGAVAKLSWSNIFKGEYFNNASLSGSPALVRADDNINFDWGTGSPGTNSDYFSVRWTGPIELPAGTYEFTVTADDGVRLWVDGNLLINQWKDQAPTSYKATTTFLVSGKHNIKMEYYEKGGGAVAKLSWKISPTVIIEGRGYGHGVGMSMTGVYFLAKDENWSYRDILTYYFSNTAWGSMDDNANIVAECTDGVKRTFKMKEYLYRLAEEPDSWPTEGLRAHTVAARSYAGEKMQSMGYVPKWGQNFLEYLDPNTRPNIVKAVNDTAGQILTYDGKPIVAAYSSSAGGYTAGLEDVWGGSPSPYLKQKPSSWDKNGNNYYWKVTVDKSTIESSYPQIGQFQDLKATSRSGYGDWGGRVIYMRLYGSKGTLNVKGYDFANKLGLKSNYFNFTY